MFLSRRTWFKMWLAPRRPRTVRRPVRLKLEQFEDRTVPTTITVTSLANSGTGTLRAAITSLDASHGTADAIIFDPSLFSGGPGTITLSTGLPAISDPMSITGPSLSGVSPRLTVQRTTAGFPPLFSIFDVSASSGSLQVTLQNLGIKGRVPRRQPSSCRLSRPCHQRGRFGPRRATPNRSARILQTPARAHWRDQSRLA